MSSHTSRVRRAAAIVVLGLVAAACAGGASAADGGLSMRITSPKDGARVSSPFVVRVDASVPLGDPSTGEHHVHLCFDGGDCDTEYTLVFGDTFMVGDLSPGEHTIEASLRNADHSDTGVSATTTIDVTGVGGSTTGSMGSTGGRGDLGY